MRCIPAILMVALAVCPRWVHAQESPFLSPSLHDALVAEVSGDIAYEHVRWFTHYHRPMGGSAGFDAVARYVEQKAREYGLDDVRTIALPMDDASWTSTLGELWLTAPTTRRLAFSPEVQLSLADYSRPTDIASARLVDVGDGTKASDYEGRDVKGTVVLASGSLAKVMQEAVWERGALGVVWFTTGRRDFPDQVPWTRIPLRNKDKTRDGTFGFVLSQREGLRLRAELAAAGSTPFTVRAKVASVMTQPGNQAIVEAVIRGTTIHDRDIVLTGHLQEERFSANDDASGSANVLEIARALQRMIDDGRLPRPVRDIRFWWTDEISAEENYFASKPAERRQVLANVNQDMVGAKQSVGSRVQYVTRPPASRASYLGDVAESIVEALVAGNSSYLAAAQARMVLREGVGASGGGTAASLEEPYSRPVIARLGTRERYDARVIPFHNNTDHQVFNQAIVGVPGITFTNWPDDYIHSSDDDLWQIDATQLKRNAVAVAAIAYYLATVDDAAGPALAAQIHARGLGRLGDELAVAAQMLNTAAPADRSAAWGRAVSLVREGARRERRAVQSVATLVPGGPKTAAAVAALVHDLPAPETAEARLTPAWIALTGEQAPPALVPTAREKELAAKTPVLVDDVKAFLDKQGDVKRPPALHGLMAHEALNFVDGTRSVLDVARAVAAEADAAGTWYYGRVSIDDVASYIDSAVQVGLVRYK
jgi:Zn-dependent M28 family amino/carboxypeptidase